MKNFYTKALQFTLALMLCFCIGGFGFSLLNKDEISYASATTVQEDIPAVNAPKATAVFKGFIDRTTEDISITEFSKVYNGTGYKINAGFQLDGYTGAIRYKWQKDTGSGYVDCTDFLSSANIVLVDVADSAKYKCLVFDDDVMIESTLEPGIESQELVVEISQKTLNIQSLEYKSREYDGTTDIAVEVTLSNPQDKYEEDTKVVGNAKVKSANAGIGKFVEKSSVTFSIAGEKANNYKLTGKEVAEDGKVDILKKKITPEEIFNWNNVSCSYDGLSKREKFIPEYLVVENEAITMTSRRSIPFIIASTINEKDGGEIPEAYKMINSGVYTLKLSPSETDYNYSFTAISNVTLTIKRIAPKFNFSKTKFVYTGYQQNVTPFVSLNNTEQKLLFENNLTYFTTYNEGINLKNNFRVYVEDSINYLNGQSRYIGFDIRRAIPKILNIENLVTTFEFSNKEIQPQDFVQQNLALPHEKQVKSNSGQTVLFILNTSNDLVAIKNSGRYERALSIQLQQDENYEGLIAVKDIVITKKQIDVSLFNWKTPYIFTYDGKPHTVKVDIPGKGPNITAIYTDDCTATNVGVYKASVAYSLAEDYNYEIKNNAYTPKLIWEIKKASIKKPKISGNQEFVFDGTQKSLSFDENFNESIMGIDGYGKINAGSYSTEVYLDDVKNYQWEDTSITPIKYNWRINKAKISAPELKNSFVFDGEKHMATLKEEDNRFQIICDEFTDVGEYNVRVLLVDPNYEWEEENNDSNYVTLSWEILPQKEHYSFTIVSIFATALVLILVVSYITLHFTTVKKQRITKEKNSNTENEDE